MSFSVLGCPEKPGPPVAQDTPVSAPSESIAKAPPRVADVVEVRSPRKDLEVDREGNDGISPDVQTEKTDGVLGQDAMPGNADGDKSETDAVNPQKDAFDVADSPAPDADLDPDADLAPDAAPATPLDVNEALKSIGRRVIVDEAALKATAANIGSAEEVMGRLDRMFEQLQVYRRIPLKPEKKSLLRSIKKYSREVGFDVQNVQMKVEDASVTGIPSSLVGKTKIHYLRGQIRGVIQMEMELTPISIDALERWIKRLPAGVDRMVEVESIRTKDKRFILKAKAFWFLPEAYPTHFPEVLSWLGYLRGEGLSESLSEIRKMADPDRWKSTREKVLGLKQSESAASRTLTMYARANHMEARWKFFESKAKKIESSGLTELFD